MLQKSDSQVYIIGAGFAGQMIASDLKRKKIFGTVAAFLDDDTALIGKQIDGIPVLGPIADVAKILRCGPLDEAIIAIPSAPTEKIREIYEILKKCGFAHIRILPSVSQIVDGKAHLVQTREIDPLDILGRTPVIIPLHESLAYLRGKRVLITGAGGSIGSELCRQIAQHEPGQLIIFDIYENNAYEIELELKENYPDLNLITLIGSVRDSRRLDQVFREYHPDIIYHAAAHKHVPLMEDSPCEAVKNNAIGTYKVAYGAMLYGVKKFVLISTDKAVNPTNVMGATKRICEMIIQSFGRMITEGRANEIPILHTHSDEDGVEAKHLPEKVVTEFAAVRFGNVLGSNGSVIPIFKKQIAKGGPVTVTHPDIIRYFMTIPEAVSLVLQAGYYGHGGEIMVLDMGEPVKIDTLARNLIKLSGHKPDEDIMIEYTGLRPGEKLYEEKLMAEEGMKTTPNKLINIGVPIEFDIDHFYGYLRQAMLVAYNDDEKGTREWIQKIVTTYHPEQGGKG